MGTILPPSEANSRAVASRFSSLRLAMTTFAPAAASRLVMALPMPRPPPVTMATLPFRVMVVVSCMGSLADVQPFPFTAVRSLSEGENRRQYLHLFEPPRPSQAGERDALCLIPTGRDFGPRAGVRGKQVPGFSQPPPAGGCPDLAGLTASAVRGADICRPPIWGGSRGTRPDAELCKTPGARGTRR